jgi:hypothetical protein
MQVLQNDDGNLGYDGGQGEAGNPTLGAAESGPRVVARNEQWHQHDVAALQY